MISAAVATLTLVSGFGLGTVLVPARSLRGTTKVICTHVGVARLVVSAIGLTWLAQSRDYAALAEGRTLRRSRRHASPVSWGRVSAKKAVRKVSLRGVRILVAVLLFGVAAARAAWIV